MNSKTYGNVRSNVLFQDPLLSLSIVFSKAITEERNTNITRTTEIKGEAVGLHCKVLLVVVALSLERGPIDPVSTLHIPLW